MESLERARKGASTPLTDEGRSEEQLLIADGRGEGPAAPLGSLDPEAARDIAILREFTHNRQRLLNQLFGPIRYSPLRDELLRLIMIEFGADRFRRVPFYVQECVPFGTEPSVRSEINLLVSVGLVMLRRDTDSPRAFLVRPTIRLVTFYNTQMPRLRSEVLRLLADR